MAKTLRGEADLLHGPVLQNMLRFALPILAGTLLQQLYSMVDAVVVGQFVGKTALAAVGGSAVAIINLRECQPRGAYGGAAGRLGRCDHDRDRRVLCAGSLIRARHAGGYHAVFHRLYALVFCRDDPHDDL